MALFMMTCYLLNALSFGLLALAGVHGYAGPDAWGIDHAVLGLCATVVYLATQTLVMFFFIGTGAAIKEHVVDHGAPVEFRRRSIALKNRLFGPLMMNILLVMTLAILGGPVHNGGIPAWIHGAMFWCVLAHFAWLLKLQHACFKETVSILEDLFAGVDGVKQA